jgi:hypothetical protein
VKDVGPGPGTYYVESPRTGGISFGSRHQQLDDEKSPGPAHYYVDKGRHGPAYSISGRHWDSYGEDSSPGPGHYYPDITTVTRSDPAWSIGGRHDVIVVEDAAPGPGTYYPENRSKGPAFSISGRHRSESHDRNPGPADYYTVVTDPGPSFSISGRHSERSRAGENPGPGTYSTEYLGPAASSRGPAYSFGSRPSTRYGDDLPGPNLYMIDPMLGETVRSTKPKAPAFSIGGKTFQTTSDQTPGPADYQANKTTLKDGPAYSISGRPNDQSYVNEEPGPADYRPLYGAVNPLKGLSFGIRHSPNKAELPQQRSNRRPV